MIACVCFYWMLICAACMLWLITWFLSISHTWVFIIAKIWNVIRWTNPGFRITAKTQEAPVPETKVEKNSLKSFNWICFSKSVSNTKKHWCLIWHVMFPTWWIHLGFNFCKMCFNSAKHRHQHLDGCKEPFIRHSWTAKDEFTGNFAVTQMDSQFWAISHLCHRFCFFLSTCTFGVTLHYC